ncbi:hypothetical protein SNE40_008549 [Patella caerulea]|uniref:G-protein coupled receptors family 1 profile domain-containing protein n=1 Tax=Patella caerulea TaxID=87958 RepID=A0AAN8QAH6_PATCE
MPRKRGGFSRQENIMTDETWNTTTVLKNITRRDRDADGAWSEYEQTEIIFNSCLIPLIILGNMIILIIVYKMGQIKRRANDILVASMAVADLFVGIYVLPLEVARFWDKANVSRLPISFCFFEQSVYLVPLCYSIQNMLLIAVDCCWSLVYPTKHRVWMTKTVAVVEVIIVWIIGIVYTTMTYIVLPVGKDRKECRLSNAVNHLFISLYPISVFLVTLGVYIKIIQVATSTHKPRIINSTGKQNLRKSKLMSFIFLIFAICWTPVSIAVIYEEFHPEFDFTTQLVCRALVTLAHVNSAVNWVVYVCRSSRFREEFTQIFRRNKIHFTEIFKKNLPENGKIQPSSTSPEPPTTSISGTTTLTEPIASISGTITHT